MLIKPVRRGGFKAMGDYILSPGKNEISRVIRIENTLISNATEPTAKDVRTALEQMETIAGSKLFGKNRLQKYLEHVSINPDIRDNLTQTQFDLIVSRIAKALGYQNCPYIIWDHVLKNRPHRHVVFFRLDNEGNLIHPFKSKSICADLARSIENEFGLVHAADKGPKAAKWASRDDLAMTWRMTKSLGAREARKVLADSGYALTLGYKDNVIVVDEEGRAFNPARITDINETQAEIKERLTKLPLSSLPTTQEVQSKIKTINTGHARNPTGVSSTKQRAKEDVATYWSQCDGKTGTEIQSFYNEKGYTLAVGDNERWLFINKLNGEIVNPLRVIKDLERTSLEARFADLSKINMPDSRSLKNYISGKSGQVEKAKVFTPSTSKNKPSLSYFVPISQPEIISTPEILKVNNFPQRGLKVPFPTSSTQWNKVKFKYWIFPRSSTFGKSPTASEAPVKPLTSEMAYHMLMQEYEWHKKRGTLPEFYLKHPELIDPASTTQMPQHLGGNHGPN